MIALPDDERVARLKGLQNRSRANGGCGFRSAARRRPQPGSQHSSAPRFRTGLWLAVDTWAAAFPAIIARLNYGTRKTLIPLSLEIAPKPTSGTIVSGSCRAPSQRAAVHCAPEKSVRMTRAAAICAAVLEWIGRSPIFRPERHTNSVVDVDNGLAGG